MKEDLTDEEINRWTDGRSNRETEGGRDEQVVLRQADREVWNCEATYSCSIC